MGKKQLFENEENTDIKITLNNDYASRYENWRRKEELNKFKARYNDEASDSDSSSSSDDEGEQITEQFEKEFFKTLSCLKKKDPSIYDEKVKFFTEEEKVESREKNKEKPMYLRDYERKLLLETEGKINDDEDSNKILTYTEEQQNIKENLKQALFNDENHESGEWGGIFHKRTKTKEELTKEEEDYRLWLKGQKENIEDPKIEEELKPLKDYWDDPNLDQGEAFLRDYMLNKRFIENDDDYIPSYEEIVHVSDKDLSEDEKAVEEQEQFETKYNFRFEEPDQEFIKRYPRTMENSVRIKSDKRKKKRVELRARKETEKQQKREELNQMKAMKRKELEEKLEKLKEITGNPDILFNDEDIDGDFDPESHDKRMKEIFDDTFYEGKESEQKPEFPDFDEELEIENWDRWNEKQLDENYEPHCEDDDFVMDCDFDPNQPSTSLAPEMMENSGGRKKRRRKTKLAEILSKPKPVFDPSNSTYEKYLDEYYKLDYEDIIGDLPCRFKYRKVIPNNFGLTTEEILFAKDKELNKWCSLKKAIQIRPENVEKYDLIAYERKSKNENLKKKILPSLYENSDDENESSVDNNIVRKNNKKKNEVFKTDIYQKSGNDKSTGNKEEDIKKNLSKNKDLEINEVTHSVLQSDEIKTNENKKIKKKMNKSQQMKRKISDENSNENKFGNLKKKQKVDSLEITNDQVQKHKNKNEVVEISNNNDRNKKKKLNLQNTKNNNEKHKSKINKKHNKNNNKVVDVISDERLKAYGLNPKKFKNKLKYGQS